jgi:hypothetical protein
MSGVGGLDLAAFLLVLMLALKGYPRLGEHQAFLGRLLLQHHQSQPKGL